MFNRNGLRVGRFNSSTRIFTFFAYNAPARRAAGRAAMAENVLVANIMLLAPMRPSGSLTMLPPPYPLEIAREVADGAKTFFRPDKRRSKEDILLQVDRIGKNLHKPDRIFFDPSERWPNTQHEFFCAAVQSRTGCIAAGLNYPQIEHCRTLVRCGYQPATDALSASSLFVVVCCMHRLWEH